MASCAQPLLDDVALALVPGRRFVLLLVRIGAVRRVLTVRAADLLPGLRLACDILSFAELQREEAPLEELLPWAGNV